MTNIFVCGSFVTALTIRVPRQPVLGENLVGDSFDLGPGGKGTNQAIAAARLGASVNLLACVGDDLFAQIAHDLYAQEGIATEHIHQISGTHCGIALINILPSGENWITVDMGANMQMTPNQVEAAEPLIAASDIIMAQFETPTEAVSRAMELGRKNQVMTILNPAPARHINPDLLANVDILTPNETEARILLGLPPDNPTPAAKLAKRLMGMGVERVVVTLGKRGALIVTPDEVVEVPSVRIQAVDVTGAGDSFNAALAVGLGEGLTLRGAVQEACYSGAYTTTHLGVIDGLPTRAERDAFLKSILGEY
jgi:ribokinase